MLFRSGVPVITSNASSMPEVAADAALLVDPDSVDSICDAMKKIFADASLRKSLSEKGMARAKLFSWEVSARKLRESIEKTVSH